MVSDRLHRSHACVTVAVVRDELFAFELDRTDFLDSTIDWRRAPFVYSHRGWKRCGIPEKLKTGIFGFMAEVGSTSPGSIFCAKMTATPSGGEFITVNGDGLIPMERKGLMNKVIYEIDPATPASVVRTLSCPDGVQRYPIKS